jgi:hypothetical protein
LKDIETIRPSKNIHLATLSLYKLYILSSDPVFVHFVYMGFAVYILSVDFASALSAMMDQGDLILGADTRISFLVAGECVSLCTN